MRLEFKPADAGPCVKQTVQATVVALDGTEFVSTNFCRNPQTTCPRGDMPSGVGYELCKSVCQQEGHAEENALSFAGDKARGATLYVEGHTYACGNCTSIAEQYGVKEIIIVKQNSH